MQEARDLDELAEQLTTEHPVVVELLIAPLEDGGPGCPVVAVRPPWRQFEALEKVVPQVGHGH